MITTDKTIKSQLKYPEQPDGVITKDHNGNTLPEPISKVEHWRIHQVAFRTSFSYNYVFRVLHGDRSCELIELEYARVCKEDQQRREELVTIKTTLKSA